MPSRSISSHLHPCEIESIILLRNEVTVPGLAQCRSASHYLVHVRTTEAQPARYGYLLIAALSGTAPLLGTRKSLQIISTKKKKKNSSQMNDGPTAESDLIRSNTGRTMRGHWSLSLHKDGRGLGLSRPTRKPLKMHSP